MIMTATTIDSAAMMLCNNVVTFDVVLTNAWLLLLMLLLLSLSLPLPLRLLLFLLLLLLASSSSAR